MRPCPQCGAPVADTDIWADFAIGRFHTACLEASEASGRWQPWQLGKGIGKASKAPPAPSYAKHWERQQRDLDAAAASKGKAA